MQLLPDTKLSCSLFAIRVDQPDIVELAPQPANLVLKELDLLS